MTKSKQSIIDNKAEITRRLDRLASVEQRSLDFNTSQAEQWDMRTERALALRTGYGPLVGMPCTYCIGSDLYAAVVTHVSPSAGKVTVQIGDMPEMQFTRRKDGSYRSLGNGAGYITFLRAVTKMDPSF